MSTNIEIFKSVLDGVSETLKKYGFEPLADNGADETVKYVGENGVIKISYENEKLVAFSGRDSENPDDTPTRILVSLLPGDASQKDVNYVVGEFCETLDTKYGVKKTAVKKASQKGPQTVSKAAVKAGSFYDPNTLASRLCLVFPELRELYKLNISTYGDFLAEEFFVNYGTPKVIEAIKENKPATMKKMFQVLNEVYEDGTNDTQSLIAVTILGELNNDQILLARCVDYMSETMAPPVIEVNKFLVTGAGKKARAKLLSPPAYKPKKQKRPGMMERMMNAGANSGQ